MKPLFLLLLLVPAAAFAQNWTTEKPLEATVVSFDKKCALLKSKDGKSFKVDKNSLHKFKLVSGETRVEYFPESLNERLCDNTK